jgi:hypothetical protein
VQTEDILERYSVSDRLNSPHNGGRDPIEPLDVSKEGD